MNLTKEILQQEFDSGFWHKEIAEKYGISTRTIYQRVKDWEIKIERKNKKKEIEWKTCSVCGKKFKQLKSDTCGPCLQNQESLQTDDLTKNTESELGQKIIKLRKQGLSMRVIADQLNCSKATVSYHCKSKTRDKVYENTHKNMWLRNFMKQLNNFKRSRHINSIEMCSDWNKKFRTATSRFQNRTNNNSNMKFSYTDALKHIGGLNCKCYLTGRPIDITKDNFQLDHIIPISKGGSCELSNLGITCPEANQSKINLTVDEYLALCKEVLEYNGYKVEKIIQ